MGSLEIRPAQDDDTTEILGVLRAALGETPTLRRTPELWAWKHQLNPYGPSIVLVAVAENRIAGVRAMMRWELITPQGHLVKCLRPVDTATHPDFARRGVFRALTLSAVELARGEGIDLVFNTPNPQSRQGYLAMGWREVGRIGVLARMRLGRATPIDSGSVPSLAHVAPDANAFVPVVSPQREPVGLRTLRSERYQSWRFGSHPTVKYGLSPDDDGAAVLRAGVRGGRAELVLSDLLGGAGSRAVRAAAKMCRGRYMAGFFSAGSPERRACLAGGMIPVPGVKPLDLVALALADVDVDVFDLGSWDVATSDFELL